MRKTVRLGLRLIAGHFHGATNAGEKFWDAVFCDGEVDVDRGKGKWNPRGKVLRQVAVALWTGIAEEIWTDELEFGLWTGRRNARGGRA
jgi:hypothetical protein